MYMLSILISPCFIDLVVHHKLSAKEDQKLQMVFWLLQTDRQIER